MAVEISKISDKKLRTMAESHDCDGNGELNLRELEFTRDDVWSLARETTKFKRIALLFPPVVATVGTVGCLVESSFPKMLNSKALSPIFGKLAKHSDGIGSLLGGAIGIGSGMALLPLVDKADRHIWHKQDEKYKNQLTTFDKEA